MMERDMSHEAFWVIRICPGVFWRHRYRYPASKWFFTVGRLVLRKWWVPSPTLAA